MFSSVKKIAAVGFLAFMLLWVIGVIRAMTLEYPPPAPLVLPIEREVLTSANYQSNNLRQIGLADTPLPLMLDRPDVDKILIDEKRAYLAAGTTAFKEDQAKVRAAVTFYQGRIFAERKGGLEPGRRWTIEVGVNPDKFDDLVEKLRVIGELFTINVDQKDRTGEFRKLHAQRQSLKKYLESISKLREGKNPSLEETLKLEQKIQDIQKELDGLSVQFGELLGKESYYHVHLTLVEHQPGDRSDRTYTIGRRVGDGFTWALAWWLGAIIVCTLVTVSWLSVRALWSKT